MYSVHLTPLRVIAEPVWACVCRLIAKEAQITFVAPPLPPNKRIFTRITKIAHKQITAINILHLLRHQLHMWCCAILIARVRFVVLVKKNDHVSAHFAAMSQKDGSLLPPPAAYTPLFSSPPTSHGLPLFFAPPTVHTVEVCRGEFNFPALHCSRRLLEPFVAVVHGTLPGDLGSRELFLYLWVKILFLMRILKQRSSSCWRLYWTKCGNAVVAIWRGRNLASRKEEAPSTHAATERMLGRDVNTGKASLN